MTIYKYLLLAISVLIISACEQNDSPIDNNTEEITGYWINPFGYDSIRTYTRANALIDNQYGLAFLADQVFIERKNSGWCGTPPISYADYDGTWQKYDSIINITVGYWGGIVNYQWKIISVDDEKLIILKLKEEYQEMEEY